MGAFLADYAFLIRGLLRLHRADGEARWLAAARELAAEQERRLAAPEGGYFNAGESAELRFRGREIFDGALPAANAVAALNALELHEATGDPAYRAAAERTLRAFAPVAASHPDGARTLTLALRRFAAAR